MSEWYGITIADDVRDVVSDSQTAADTWASKAELTLDDIKANINTYLDLASIAYSVTGLPSFNYASVGTLTKATVGDSTTPSATLTLSLPSAIDIGSAPGYSTTLPGTPSSISAIDISDIPELAALVLPTVDIEIPTYTYEELIADFVYTEPTYTNKVSDEVQSLLQTVLAGNLIVSTSVWDNIWDRAAGDAARVQVAEEWEAANVTAGMGMTGLPNESLLSRIATAAQKARELVSKVRLEQAIQEATQRREDLWAAVKESIAFEGMWLEFHNAIAGRALTAAIESVKAKVSVYNANAEVFNIIVGAIAQEVAAKRIELEIALAPLQVFSAQLEGVKTEILKDEQIVKRWLGEWDGYKSEGGLKLQQIESQTKGYETTVDAKVKRQSALIEVEKLKIQKFQEDLNLFKTKWDAISTKAKAIIDLTAPDIQIQELSLEDKKLDLGYQAAKSQQQISIAKDAPLVGIEKAKIQLEQSLSVLEKIAQLQVGVTQAYLSAIDANLNASMSTDENLNYSM